MKYLPYLFVLVLLGGLVMMSLRNRRRALAEDEQRDRSLTVGTDVMTTSGLYGTITARNDDGTVQLSIAPGLEVRWALAALRDADSLADRYRRGLPGDTAETVHDTHENTGYAGGYDSTGGDTDDGRPPRAVNSPN